MCLKVPYVYYATNKKLNQYIYMYYVTYPLLSTSMMVLSNGSIFWNSSGDFDLAIQ